MSPLDIRLIRIDQVGLASTAARWFIRIEVESHAFTNRMPRCRPKVADVRCHTTLVGARAPAPESDVIARFNLIGDGSGSGITNTDGNQVGKVSPNSSAIDPRLGPLADNGGPTRTHALLLGSPAIDAAQLAGSPR